jgi:protein-S-isoprenylcysteine O-methyltransferase Ste14
MRISPVLALRGGYALLAYSAFTAVSLWGVLFLAGAGPFPTLESHPSGPAWAAVAVDVGLWLVFALQHSLMARAPVKARLTRAVPEQIERSTYVLAGSLALGLLFWQWRALPGTVWEFHAQPWVALTWTGYGAGWLVAIAATHMIDHWEFLGVKQAGRGAGAAPPAGTVSEAYLYAWVRHPMMTGLLVAFWVTPVMTAGHLLFALAATGYVAIGVHHEERGLRRQFGTAYEDYARRVPRFVPRFVPGLSTGGRPRPAAGEGSGTRTDHPVPAARDARTAP